ncbi:hypothetical protein TGS27_1643 [Geobacillus stearothermophilus]|uniref:Uncharacterized protein n=1 Tax=Geobacillus stearothermophilus TaxID=1422 RepID=A0A150N655_GEOSE|nr:hypothetical protein I656_02718 [Geobacillus sp. WSUCF1]KAF6510306.1 hypothetical protein GS8_2463 [Geobacillus stearothermophilus]KYD27410.1 hypothetical protein B4109_3138 [Geobacillus stearothermophilus]KYD32175.1 hypothetical protein B4114_1718 [Geobacillus stearothermophilus]OAO81500.1 hypothetical protein TGS27_1643 [Geobacillus stearothermophilus]
MMESRKWRKKKNGKKVLLFSSDPSSLDGEWILHNNVD